MFEGATKKQKTKLLGSLITMALLGVLAVVVLIAYLNKSFSWFSNNRNVSGTGMSVQVEVSPNMVVSDSSTAITNYSESGWNQSYFEKVWDESPLELIPVDHYDDSVYTTVEGTDVFHLVYNTNPEAVNRSTGKGDGLTFAYVPADGENVYFIDRVIYIASLSREMTQGNDYSRLTFSIAENGAGTTTNASYKSASVDVYVNSTFKGTLNLDTLDSFYIVDVDTIPLNTSGSIQITFRCYFDGALQNTDAPTKNYVNSRDLAVNTANIAIDITVTAE